jgi:hypothetical protein
MDRDTKRIVVVAGSLVGALVLIVAALALGVFYFARMTPKRVPANIPDPVPEKIIPPADPGLLSKPADPWTVAPVPIKSVLLVMPFRHDEVYDDTGRTLVDVICHRWSIDMQRDFAIIPLVNVNRMISKMSVYTKTYDYRFEKAVEDAITQFTKPTHRLRGTWREENGAWIIDAEFNARDKAMTETFRVPAGNDLQASHEIIRWMVEVGDFGLEPATAALLLTPTCGPTILSGKDPRYEKLFSDPHDPTWDALFAASPHSARLINACMGAAVHAKDSAMIDQLDPGVLEPGAPVALHLARRQRFDYLKQKDAARHELELIMAKYPGLMSKARDYTFDFFEQGEFRDDYMQGVQEWHRRSRPSSLADSWLAGAHKQVAWDYRGSGWANTVSDNAWRQFRSHNEQGILLLEKTLKDAPPTPYVCEELCQIYGSNGPGEKMHAVHEILIRQWPDCIDTWYAVLNYTRPRWGGSNEEAMALIDRAMASRPNNAAMGSLAVYYHHGESAIEFKQSIWYNKVSDYAKAHPDRARQLREAGARLASPLAKDEDAAVAVNVAAMLDDDKLAGIAVTNHPDLYKYIRYRAYSSWYGTTMARAAFAYAGVGNWEKLKAVSDLAQKDDDALWASGQTPWEIVFWDKPAGEYLRAVLDAMTGDPQKGIARLEVITKDNGRCITLNYLRVKFGEPLPPDAEEKVTKAGQTEKKDEGDALCVLALIAFQRGDKARAQELLARAESHKDHLWKVLREDAWRTIKGTPPPADSPAP